MQVNLKNNKIILHNLTFRGIEKIPGVMDFDQRGVVFANPKDIIITKTPIESSYLKYLESLGWNFQNCVFLTPTVTKTYQYNSIFYDTKILAELTSLDNYYLDTYNTTREEQNFAQKISKPIYANCQIAEQFGTKSGFRKLAAKLAIPIAPGKEDITDIRTLHNNIMSLCGTNSKHLVIKIDEGISGAGSTKLAIEDYQKLFGTALANFLTMAVGQVPQNNPSNGVVVEQWIEDVVASPSIQIEVLPDKTWQIVSMHEQLLEKIEKWYIGCKYPSYSLQKNPQLPQILADLNNFMKCLTNTGFIGFLGLDIIITADQKYYWVEANIRKSGTFYPRVIVEKLNAGNLSNISYIATDFTVPSLVGASFLNLYTLLEDLLYTSTTQSGLVLYNTGALQDTGRFDIVCLGKQESTMNALYAKAVARISELIAN